MNVARLPRVGDRWMSRRLAEVGVTARKGGAVVVTGLIDGPDAHSTMVGYRFIASGSEGSTNLAAFERAFVFDSEPDDPMPVVVGPTCPRTPHLEVVG